jgi:serine kinase of HPr protein (carbohydrate metabolism regulator)
MSQLVHATCVDIAGLGVLILGSSGAGKSDLALRLIAEGALLVSDDQTAVAVDGETLRATAPAQIKGLIEVRGVGIGPAAVKLGTRLALAVQSTDQVERMPERGTWSLPGTAVAIPLLALNPFEASAPAKVRFALGQP